MDVGVEKTCVLTEDDKKLLINPKADFPIVNDAGEKLWWGNPTSRSQNVTVSWTTESCTKGDAVHEFEVCLMKVFVVAGD